MKVLILAKLIPNKRATLQASKGWLDLHLLICRYACHVLLPVGNKMYSVTSLLWKKWPQLYATILLTGWVAKQKQWTLTLVACLGDGVWTESKGEKGNRSCSLGPRPRKVTSQEISNLPLNSGVALKMGLLWPTMTIPVPLQQAGLVGEEKVGAVAQGTRHCQQEKGLAPRTPPGNASH